jgi:uncharacterized protein (DUF2236 family)
MWGQALSRRVQGEVGLDLPPLPPGRPGDPGLFGPGSMIWRVARERVLIAVGPSALLMQLAHPLVAAAVDDHSDFRLDPFARLRETLDTTLTISFGDSEQAARAADRVRTVHGRVRGRLPASAGPHRAGTSYDATDPGLALWVHATLLVAALDGYDRLVRPLRWEERARYFEEARPFAELFGVGPEVMPRDYGAFESYVEEMVGALAVSPAARELGAAVLDPPVRRQLAPAAKLGGVLTAGFLPPALRGPYGLPFDRDRRALFRSVAAVTRTSIPFLPPTVRFWPHARTAARRVGAARARGGGAGQPGTARRSGTVAVSGTNGDSPSAS